PNLLPRRESSPVPAGDPREAASGRSLLGKRHLVVAATGTGKTMIAAFDYRRLCRERGVRPSLLFVAHRDEILDQALGAYRTVLRDHSFGERLGGGHSPGAHDHLFATIQSLDRQDLVARVGGARWDVVVVDEFHHAAASTYRRLLDSLEPGILLGLTATPERSDLADILGRFGGQPSAEIRLWDAIDRQLVAPFDYFGISDNTNLNEVRWARGRYVESDLEKLYTGDDARAALVLEELNRKSGDARRVRALAFCVGVSHAEFMARKFSEWGVPALAVHGGSIAEVRREAKNAFSPEGSPSSSPAISTTRASTFPKSIRFSCSARRRARFSSSSSSGEGFASRMGRRPPSSSTSSDSTGRSSVSSRSSEL
ncbi:MAG: DEAD/DEAH box helicase family protein, partial [Holophagales bacterium]|nr:DEAD/DEAH box helicase family protein [Holophagales bacterium]